MLLGMFVAFCCPFEVDGKKRAGARVMKRMELEEVVPAHRTNGGHIYGPFFYIGSQTEELAPFFCFSRNSYRGEFPVNHFFRCL